jgi:hypothetical protein
LTTWTGDTSVLASAPPHVSVKPVEATALTTIVPGMTPAVPLIAACRFAVL